MMFTHILYATDGSEHARKALDYTSRLARLTEARITVLHAYPPLPRSDFGAMISTSEYNKLLHYRMAEGNKILDEAMEALEEEGIEAERDLTEGPMAEAILSAARARNCDLIIVGARGLSNLQGLLLGSVSQKVIQHANCPVLVVR
jgi:nucleotide-binding universal stress UspA family protein